MVKKESRLGLIYMLLMIMLLFGCGSDNSNNSEVHTISFETIDQGLSSGIEISEPDIYKIDNQTDWDDFWALHNPPPGAVQPVINFSNYMIIAVIDMVQPTGVPSLEISSITEINNILIVKAIRNKLGANCSQIAVQLNPFHIVQTNKYDIDVELDLSTIEKDCSQNL